MTTSVSRKLTILCIMFKIIKKLQLRCSPCNSCGKHLHGRIISTDFEVHVPSKKSEWSCIFLLGVSNLSLSTILELFRQRDIFCFSFYSNRSVLKSVFILSMSLRDALTSFPDSNIKLKCFLDHFDDSLYFNWKRYVSSFSIVYAS
jgi:hypothetical protein